MQHETCELTRVALKGHHHPVSKILSLTIKFIKKFYPNIKLLVSFADTKQNHHGGIYQATNWVYLGKTKTGKFFEYNKKIIHPRTISSWRKRNDDRIKYCKKVKTLPKHRYVYPICNSMYYLKRQSLPYPKRVEHESNATDNHSVEGGAIPTSTLQSRDDNV